MQNNNIIIRNIKVLKVKKKKDLLGLIKFEINQYIPININNYEVKYKILDSKEDKQNIQVILIPRCLIDLCKEITNMLNMKLKGLSVDCDILQKMINLDMVDSFINDGIFIESKSREFALNIVKNKKVYESYIFPKSEQYYEFAIKLMNGSKDIYYYGEEDIFTKIKSRNNFNISTLKLKEKTKLIIKSSNIEIDNIKYLRSIGLII